MCWLDVLLYGSYCCIVAIINNIYYNVLYFNVENKSKCITVK